MLIDHVDEAIAKMQQLRAIGIQFSAMILVPVFLSSYLKRLSSQIKTPNHSSATYCPMPTMRRSVAPSLHRGNLAEVIAGVETAAQWSFLRAEGCQRAQGSGSGRLMPGGSEISAASRSGSVTAPLRKSRRLHGKRRLQAGMNPDRGGARR